MKDLMRINRKWSWLVSYLPPHPLRFACNHCGFEWKREDPLLTAQGWMLKVCDLTDEHRKCPPPPGNDYEEKEY